MLQQLSKKLKQTPDSFDDLKSVLGTIAAIRDMSLEVEMRFTDIQERYRTLAMYKLEVLCHLYKAVIPSKKKKYCFPQ